MRGATGTDHARHHFDNIVEASEHIGAPIEDLLHYARLGRKSVHSESVGLNEVFDEYWKHGWLEVTR